MMVTRNKRMRLVAPAFVPLVLIGCATVPLTDRAQLALVPQDQLMQLSLDSYQKILSQSELSRDPQQIELVNRVGTRLARATEDYLRRQNYPPRAFAWEFNVIKDDSMANAWCLPGGKVAVYTGILPVTQTEAGLAVVVGHEIAHVVANHGNERLSEAMLVELGGQALGAAMQQRPAQTQNMFMRSYGVVSQAGVLLPHSRRQESEADRIGLTLMAAAGYDPREAIGLWERMAEAGGNMPRALTFLATHPAPQQRIENIRQHLPEAMAVYGAPAGAMSAPPPAPSTTRVVDKQVYRRGGP
jgi:predicted Zn-dependent protease